MSGQLTPVDEETEALADAVLADAWLGTEEAAEIVERINANPNLQPLPQPAPEPKPVPPPPAPTTTQQQTVQPLDFAKVEKLRGYMMLTVDNMADLVGVSRVTYFNWAKGGTIRKTNQAKLREVLGKLLKILQSGWPNHDIIVMTGPERFAALLAAMKETT